MSRTGEGVKRTGRVSLWLMLPPVGLWRSVRHGRRKSEDRLASKIRGDQPRRLSLPERIERHAEAVRRGD
jgi:hypothetical protein